MKRKDRMSVGSMWRHIFVVAICWCMLFMGGSCKDDDNEKGGGYDPNAPVKVTNITPDSGGIAKPVVITGENFGTDKTKVKVFFDDKEAMVINTLNEHLYAVVPKLKGGEHTVRIVVDGQNEGVLKDKKFEYIVASSVSTVAGLGVEADRTNKDDGEALEARFFGPMFLCMDDQDNIIVSDAGYDLRLLSLTSNTVVTLFRGTNSNLRKGVFTNDFSYLYIPVRSTTYDQIAHEFYRNGNWAQGLIVNNGFNDWATSMAIDDEGNKFIIGARRSGLIAKINHKGVVEVIGSWPQKFDYGSLVMTYNPLDKYIYISSQYEHMIVRFDSRKETLTDDDFEIYAGQFKVAGFYNGYRTEATFNEPWGIAFDNEGNLFIADQSNNAIRKIDPEGNVTTFAGTGKAGFKDGEIETSQFDNPTDVTVSQDGIVYVADYNNYRIRCIAVQ